MRGRESEWGRASWGVRGESERERVGERDRARGRRERKLGEREGDREKKEK